MQTTLTVFNYENNQVRNVVIKGEPWFVLADVCKVLDLSNPTMVAKKLDKDERAKSDLGLQERNVTLINESGLYAIVLRSDKPQAKPFRKWITSEVLPTIRRLEVIIPNPRTNFGKRMLKFASRTRKYALHSFYIR